MTKLIKKTKNVRYFNFSNLPTFEEDWGSNGASTTRPPIHGASLTLRLDRVMDSDSDSDSDTATTSKTDQRNEKVIALLLYYSFMYLCVALDTLSKWGMFEMAKTTETPLLLAARNGITEMVMLILKKYPMAISDKIRGKNIVHLAAENKEPHVLQVLLSHKFVRRKLIREVDNEGNNALHLAAKLEGKKPWLIPGSALQMQWEMKWYEV